MLLTANQILELDQIKRLNLINSITGVKPANLIGTYNKTKQSNLAIFSSVVHLGSNPALLGFITRPSEKVPRHTLDNIIKTEYFTINHVPTSMIKQAHQTAAKYPKNESEFKQCGFTEAVINDFPAPFVKEATIQIGLKLTEILPIKINQTQMVIGQIQILQIDDQSVSEEGYINLEQAGTAGISGLNSYYKLQYLESFPYARPD